MKRITMIMLAALIAVSSPVFAQDDDEMKFTAGIKAGWYFLQDEPITDFIEDAWLIGADVTAWWGDFGLGVEMLYSDSESDPMSHMGVTDVVTELTLIPVSLNAYYKMPMSNEDMSVYVGGGLTYVLTDVSTSSASTGISFDSDEGAFGFNGLVGLQFNNFFAEAKYIWAEPELEHLAAGAQDMPVSGFALLGGFRF